MTSQASNANDVLKRRFLQWLKPRYDIISSSRDPDDDHTRANGALGQGGAPVPTGIPTGTQGQGAANAHPFRDNSSATISETSSDSRRDSNVGATQGPIVHPVQPDVLASSSPRGQSPDETFDDLEDLFEMHETTFTVTGQQEEQLPGANSVHPPTQEILQGVTEVIAIVQPESPIMKRNASAAELSALYGPNGTLVTSEDTENLLRRVQNLLRRVEVRSPVSVFADLETESHTPRKKAKRGNLGDPPSDTSCDVYLANMPELQPKLAYLAQMTSMPVAIDNIRLKNGKVCGVNKSKKPNGKFDARYVRQLPIPGSQNRESFNLYIASYEHADDATAAVALLDANLQARVHTHDGNDQNVQVVPYFQVLKAIQDKEQREQVKQMLLNTVRGQVKTMIKEVKRDMPVAQAFAASADDGPIPLVQPWETPGVMTKGTPGAVSPSNFALVGLRLALTCTPADPGRRAS